MKLVPRLIFVKVAQGHLSLRSIFNQKFEIFASMSYLRTHFYSYNVEIWLKRTDLGNARNPSTTKFCQNHSRDYMLTGEFLVHKFL